MSTVIKTGWLNDKNGDKFAPKTLISQVVATDGTTLEDAIEVKLDEFKNDIASQDHNHDDIYETKEDAQVKYDELVATKADKEHSHSWSDLEDRPFGSEIVNEPIEITWDGDKTDKIDIVEWSGFGNCYLGDYGITHYDQLLGGTVKIGENTYILDYYDSWGDIGYSIQSSEESYAKVVIITEQNEDYPIGVYAYYSRDTYVSYIKTNSFERETINKLDAKYLPENIQSDWNQNDETAIDYIRNRPFYEGEMLVTYVEGEPLNVNGSDGEYRGYIDKYSGFIKGIIKPNQLYNLTFDGVLYENIMCYGEEGSCYLGITEEDFYNNPNIEYPCSVSYTDYYDVYFIGLRDDAPHTIKIEALEFAIKQIDAKYIPNIVGKNVHGIITDTDGAEVTDNLGAEIFNDYTENKAIGQYSHAEGQGTIASGDWAHTEGLYTTASGDWAHAEGHYSTASGTSAHAEGGLTVASGNFAHAEGNDTTASGYVSHAEGEGTLASSGHQHVQGKYNVEDTSNTYAHIVGNGEANNKRSNAHTVDWDGNAWFAGNIRVGGTEYDNGSEVALKSDLANIDLSKYETKTDSQSKLDEAKAYADSAASTVKNDLLNGAGAAYDTLKELGELIVENKDAIDVLEDVATGKADAVHSHAISEVSGLQSALDSKADASHGTHVTFDSINKPKMDGTSAFGTSTSVARADHVHPTDTSRASQTDLDNHIADSTKHITSTERTNWNTAKSHADSAHAPSNAQANVIESIKVNGATQIITNKSVDITVPTDATDIGAAPATHGHAISDITDLQTTLSNAANAIQTNTNSINAHTDRISSLETKVGDGFEEISSEEIAALFAN